MINADVNQTANHTRRRHRLLHLLSPPPLNLWHTPVAWAFGLPRALRVSALQHDHQHTGRRKQVPRQFPLCRSPRQSSQPATQATARSTHVADCRNRGESTTVGSVLCSGGGEFLPSAPPPRGRADRRGRGPFGQRPVFVWASMLLETPRLGRHHVPIRTALTIWQLRNPLRACWTVGQRCRVYYRNAQSRLVWALNYPRSAYTALNSV